MNELEELLLKSRLRLAPSPIHGVGVFAVADFKSGEKVYADEFPKLYQVTPNEIPKQLLERHVPAARTGKLAYPDVRFQAYMNHSNDPNYDNLTDTALRDIKAGDEVTEDYRNIPGYQQVFHWLV